MEDIDLGTDINLDEIKADGPAFREKYSRDQDHGEHTSYGDWFETRVSARNVQDDSVRPSGFMPDSHTMRYAMSADNRTIVGGAPGLNVVVNLETQQIPDEGIKMSVGSMTFVIGQYTLAYKMDDVPEDTDVLTDTEDRIYRLSNAIVDMSEPGLRKLCSLIDDAVRAVKCTVDAGNVYLRTHNKLRAEELQ